MDVNLADKQGKQSSFPVRGSEKTEDNCSRTAETGSHLCISAITGELSKAPGGSSRPHIFILSFSELLTTQGTAAYADVVVTTVIFHDVI